MMRKFIAGLMAMTLTFTTFFGTGFTVSAESTNETETVTETENPETELPENEVSAPRVEAGAHTDHCFCGGNCDAATAENGHTHQTMTWTGVTSLQRPATGNTKADYLTSNITIANTTQANNAQLLKDSTWYICLNGYTIDMASGVNRRMFHLYNASYSKTNPLNAKLVICDCNGGGKIIANEVDKTFENGGLGIVAYGSELQIYGGEFQGETVSKNGGTFAVWAGSRFLFYGGTIKGGQVSGSSSAQGGNIYVGDESEFYMYGGTVEDGVANATSGESDGGNMYLASPAYLLGGTIQNGTATNPTKSYGGNVYVKDNTEFKDITIKDGTSTGTSTGGYGSNIAFYGKKNATIDGDTLISGGTAKQGSVYICGEYQCTMENGTIENGTATDVGGCVAVMGTTGGTAASPKRYTMFTMNGGLIQGGKCHANGGNVRVNASQYNESWFILNGGTIKDGWAAYDTTGGAGGNLEIGNYATLLMNGGLVEGGMLSISKTKTSSTSNIQSNSNNARMVFQGGVVKGHLAPTMCADFAVSGTIKIHDENYGVVLSHSKDTSGVRALNPRIGSIDTNGNAFYAPLLEGADVWVTEHANTLTKPYDLAFADGTLSDAKYITGSGNNGHNRLYVDTQPNDSGTNITGLYYGTDNGQHCFCGGNCEQATPINGHTCVAANSIDWEPYSKLDKTKTTPQYLYLTASVTGSLTTEVGNQIYLCLNGFDFKANTTTRTSRAFCIWKTNSDNSSTYVYICDCSENKTGRVVGSGERTTQGDGASGGGVMAITQSGHMTIFNATLLDGSSLSEGGLLNVSPGTLTCYGTTLKGGIAENRGGTINAAGSAALKFYGCTIEGGRTRRRNDETDSVTGGSMFYVSNNADLEFKDCKLYVTDIEETKSDEDEGVIDVAGGTLKFTNCEFYGNALNEKDSFIFDRGSGGIEITNCTYNGYHTPFIKTDGDGILLNGGTYKNTDAPVVSAGMCSMEIDGGRYSVDEGNVFVSTDYGTTNGVFISDIAINDGYFNGGIDGGVLKNYIYGGYFKEKPATGSVASGVVLQKLATPAEGIYNYATSNTVKVSLTSGTEENKTSSIANLQGGGIFAIGSDVTLNAPLLEGYSFSGWYKKTGSTTWQQMSTNSKYTFTVNADINLSAVYNVNSSLLTFTASAPKFTYKVSGKTMADISNVAENLPAGTDVELHFTDANTRFLAWLNSANKILSTDKDFTFAVTGTMAVHALYDNGAGSSGTKVNYITDSGQVLLSTKNSAPITDYECSAPFRFGKKFVSWNKTLEEINAAIQGKAASIDVITIFENDTTQSTYSYTIQKVKATSANPADYMETNLVAFGDAKQFTTESGNTSHLKAETVQGSNFICWVRYIDSDVELLSYASDFHVFPGNQQTVYAVYCDTETAEKAPTTVVTTASATPQDKDQCLYTYSSVYHVPEGYRYMSSGMIYTNDVWMNGAGLKGASTHLLLNDETYKVAVWNNTSQEEDIVTTLNLKNIPNGYQFYVRAFVRYQKEGGDDAVYTTYSDIVYGGYPNGFLVAANGARKKYQVSEIALDCENIELKNLDDTANMQVSIVAPDGVTAQSIVWASSNPDTVSVTPFSSNPSKATVKALKNGYATITVNVDGIVKNAIVRALHPDHAVARHQEIVSGTGSPVSWNAWSSATSLPSEGQYYLTKDVTLSDTVTVASGKTLSLCFNGHTVTAASTMTTTRMVTCNGGTVNFCDCLEEGGFYNNNQVTVTGSMFCASTGSKVNIYGGNFTAGPDYYNADPDSTSSRLGALFYVAGAGTQAFMHGGVIENGVSDSQGGNVAACSNAEFNFYGGIIRNGRVFSGKTKNTNGTDVKKNTYGGNLFAWIATIRVRDHYGDGALVTGGSATENDGSSDQGRGGNIFISGGNLYMTQGGLVTGGEATFGGNVFLSKTTDSGKEYNCSVVIENSYITKGSAYAGGGINAQSGSVTIRGTSEITDNRMWGNRTSSSTCYGGGIYYSVGSLILKDHIKIKDNYYQAVNDTTGATRFNRNLHVVSGLTATVSELSEDAEIGITMENNIAPLFNTNFSKEATEQIRDCFTSDLDASEVVLVSGKLQIKEKFMQVGFGRVSTNPVDENGTFYVPMAGYGNNQFRLSKRGAAIGAESGEQYGLECTCIAITGTNNETLLMYTVDIISVGASMIDAIRTMVTEATGIPKDHISITATHTHSGPDLTCSDEVNTFTDANGQTSNCKKNITRYKEIFKQAFVDAAEAALADQTKVTTLSSGTVDTENTTGKFNEVRHYEMISNTNGPNGKPVQLGVSGNNFNFTGITINSTSSTRRFVVDGKIYTPKTGTSVTDPNTNMMLVAFEREGKKPVVMCNFRAHMTYQAGGLQEYISERQYYTSDFAGAFRRYVEKNWGTNGCLCGYYQGDCGNINPCKGDNTNLKSAAIKKRTNVQVDTNGDDVYDKTVTMSNNFEYFGQELGKVAVNALNNTSVMKDSKGDGKALISRENYIGFYKNKNYYDETVQGYAQEIVDYFKDTYGKGNYQVGIINAMVLESGGLVHSYYDASNILSRLKTTMRTETMEINGIRIGKVGFTTSPYEMFDTDGDIVRQNGTALPGYTTVCVLGYSNGSFSYVPSKRGFTQGSRNIQICGSTTNKNTPYTLSFTLNGVKKEISVTSETQIGSYEADQCHFVPAVDTEGRALYGLDENGEPQYIGEDLADHLVDLLRGIQ